MTVYYPHRAEWKSQCSIFGRWRNVHIDFSLNLSAIYNNLTKWGVKGNYWLCLSTWFCIWLHGGFISTIFFSGIDQHVLLNESDLRCHNCCYVNWMLTILIRSLFLCRIGFASHKLKPFHYSSPHCSTSSTRTSRCSLWNVSILSLCYVSTRSGSTSSLSSPVPQTPAPSCPFQLFHCTSLHSAGRRLPQWPLRGPIPSTALMQCSCFQIQPLILILFLLFNSAVPVDSSDLVVHCGRLMI